MKIQEFRELIKAADRELLEKAFAESYKKFTKGQKEEVDLIIQGVLAGEDARSVAKKDTISFELFCAKSGDSQESETQVAVSG